MPNQLQSSQPQFTKGSTQPSGADSEPESGSDNGQAANNLPKSLAQRIQELKVFHKRAGHVPKLKNTIQARRSGLEEQMRDLEERLEEKKLIVSPSTRQRLR